MQEKSPQIEESWLHVLAEEFKKDYFLKLKDFLTLEKTQYRIFPPGNLIFNAFNLTPFDEVKVVILGQDPYHGFGQAHGLCFSVPDGVKAPPSLINIFKEIKDDVGIEVPPTGNFNSLGKTGGVAFKCHAYRKRKSGRLPSK